MTIYGKLIDENYSRILMEEQDLSLTDVMLLDRIQKQQPVDKAMVKGLRRRNLIEGRYPNIYISAVVAKTTGQQAEYTKHRAFDNPYYKDLIIRFLEQHGKGISSDFQVLLMDKLSDTLNDRQKKDKVRNLLQELAREDKIENTGTRGKGACWTLKLRS
jgi:ATP-dependent DNA helicase RecG